MEKQENSHNPEKDLLQSTRNALKLIRALAQKPNQSPAQLAKALGLSRGSVYRLLWTLEAERVVTAGKGSALYSLGPFFLDLALARTWEQSLIDVSLPALVRLRRATNETVGVYLARAAEVVCAEILDSPYEIRRTTRVGESIHPPAGATAKCFLAWRITEVAYPHEFLISIGIASSEIPSWIDRLAQIREDGYAVTWQERVLGGCAISAPVCDRNGFVRALITLSGPTGRITIDQVDAFAAKVQEAALETQLRLHELATNSSSDRSSSVEPGELRWSHTL